MKGRSNSRIPAISPSRTLNTDQAAAVRLALGAEPVALIHGPPGTGKTHTLVEVVRLAVARGERVLACAMSNVATDHLARRLMEAGLDIIRLGHPVRVAPDLANRTLERLLDETYAGRLAQEWMAEARDIVPGPSSVGHGGVGGHTTST